MSIEQYEMNSSSLAVNNTALTASAVSWGAILAGATAAAAMSLILLLLGASWGFSAISPWAMEDVSAKAFGISSILWVTLTSLIAAGIGGYLAGRLRTRWLAVHSDEIYFRDTAHGFLAWAVATLLTATLLTTTISGILKGGVQTATAIGTAMAAAPDDAETEYDATDYFIDSLFRTDANSSVNTAQNATPIPTETTTEDGSTVSDTSITNVQQHTQPIPKQDLAEIKAEAMLIFKNALWNGSLSKEDLTYVGQKVAQHSNIPPAEAEQRVNDIFTKVQNKIQEAETAAKDMADEARKASAYTSLWLFIALLIGAFIASFTAIYGGRQRDL